MIAYPLHTDSLLIPWILAKSSKKTMSKKAARLLLTLTIAQTALSVQNVTVTGDCICHVPLVEAVALFVMGIPAKPEVGMCDKKHRNLADEVGYGVVSMLLYKLVSYKI